MQKNAEFLEIAAEKISQLIFYPEKIVAAVDGSMKPEALNLSRETFSVRINDMLLVSMKQYSFTMLLLLARYLISVKQLLLK